MAVYFGRSRAKSFESPGIRPQSRRTGDTGTRGSERNVRTGHSIWRPIRRTGLPIPRVDFRPDASYFTSPKKPFGPEALDLAVGPIRMRLQGLFGSQTTVT